MFLSKSRVTLRYIWHHRGGSQWVDARIASVVIRNIRVGGPHGVSASRIGAGQGGIIPRRWWSGSRLRQRTREGERGLMHSLERGVYVGYRSYC